MAGKLGDSEQQRVIDRIMCVAFRIARDEGANFINRKWIAKKLGRSPDWVTDNWSKSPEECFTQFGEGRPQQLSQESKNIIIKSCNKRRNSNQQVIQKFCNVVTSMFAKKQCGNIVNVRA